MTDGTKVAIVGAGRVGSTFAYTLAASGLARHIVLIDSDRKRAEGEAMYWRATELTRKLSHGRPVRV